MAKNMIKLVAPEGATSVSFEGETYEVKKGMVEVPAQAAADLCAAHGYAAAASKPGGTGPDRTAANTVAPAATSGAPAASGQPWLKG